jgi:hypothetical protein
VAWGISWFLGEWDGIHDPMRDGCHGSPTHTVAWQRPTKSGHWAGARGAPTPEAPPNTKPSNSTCPSWDGGDWLLLLRLHNTQQRSNTRE